ASDVYKRQLLERALDGEIVRSDLYWTKRSGRSRPVIFLRPICWAEPTTRVWPVIVIKQH
ncbi:hypothetical protein, partial [Streptomyces alkaliphilus]|uniref:hypothetical protein n=1 Tax=Streptomyces alkaliphilus TaxID=1472722 RepID=UPI0015F95D2F